MIFRSNNGKQRLAFVVFDAGAADRVRRGEDGRAYALG